MTERIMPDPRISFEDETLDNRSTRIIFMDSVDTCYYNLASTG